MKHKKCLLYIISPTHVISSISAIETMYHDKKPEVTLLIHWPGVPKKETKSITKVIKKLVSGFDFVIRIITISQDKVDNLFISKETAEAKQFPQKIFRETRFDEIYYSQDVVGQMYQWLCIAYPKAQRICYGDALGNVYEKEFHLSLLKIQVPTITQIYKPHKAVLILPVDQSGNFLKNIQLIVCNKKTVLKVMTKLVQTTKELQSYIRDLLNEYRDKNKYLLLTENIAEGNFMDFNKEIEMYCSIIEEYVPFGSVVFIKPHPLETIPRYQKIKDRLGPERVIVKLNDKFIKYPIEIWKELIINCQILTMSYPVLSLKYLYNKDVIQPMDNKFIEKWFPEGTWRSYKNALELYTEPLRKLDGWEEKNILWRPR